MKKKALTKKKTKRLGLKLDHGVFASLEIYAPAGDL